MFPELWFWICQLHFVQDMYDLSLNCFRELADRIDELALEIASTRREGLAGSKTRHQEEPMVAWTRCQGGQLDNWVTTEAVSKCIYKFTNHSIWGL